MLVKVCECGAYIEVGNIRNGDTVMCNECGKKFEVKVHKNCTMQYELMPKIPVCNICNGKVEKCDNCGKAFTVGDSVVCMLINGIVVHFCTNRCRTRWILKNCNGQCEKGVLHE